MTRLAVLYVESFGSPRGFARTARRVGQHMPVLTVIGGRSAAGPARGRLAHGSCRTPLVTQEALFGQAGIIATRSLGELVEAAALLASQPLPAGGRVAIVSNAGGAGVLAADACGDSGLDRRDTGRGHPAPAPRAAAGRGGCRRARGHHGRGDRGRLPRLPGAGRRRRGVDALIAVDRAHGHRRPAPRDHRRGRDQADGGRPAGPGRVRPAAPRRGARQPGRPAPRPLTGSRPTPIPRAPPGRSVMPPGTGPGGTGRPRPSPSSPGCAPPRPASWSPGSWRRTRAAAGCRPARRLSCSRATRSRWRRPAGAPAARPGRARGTRPPRARKWTAIGVGRRPPVFGPADRAVSRRRGGRRRLPAAIAARGSPR